MSLITTTGTLTDHFYDKFNYIIKGRFRGGSILPGSFCHTCSIIRVQSGGGGRN